MGEVDWTLDVPIDGEFDVKGKVGRGEVRTSIEDDQQIFSSFQYKLFLESVFCAPSWAKRRSAPHTPPH